MSNKSSPAIESLLTALLLMLQRVFFSVLHNISELNNDTCNLEWIHIDESPHDSSSPAADVSRRTTESATHIRDILKDYLNAHQ